MRYSICGMASKLRLQFKIFLLIESFLAVPLQHGQQHLKYSSIMMKTTVLTPMVGVIGSRRRKLKMPLWLNWMRQKLALCGERR